jgi:hypothetical protein
MQARKTLWSILVAITLIVPAVSAAPLTPDQTAANAVVKSFFAAALKGDLVAVEKLLTGRALKFFKREIIGESGSLAKAAADAKRFGKSFAGITRTTVKGDRAEVWYLQELAALYPRNRLASVIATRIKYTRPSLKRAKTQAERDRLTREIEYLKKGKAVRRFGLAKVSGKWLISEVK